MTWSENGDWLTPALPSDDHWRFSVRLDCARPSYRLLNTYVADPAFWDASDGLRASMLSVSFLLIRHGSVDYDAHPGRFRGHGIDLLPLTSEGVAQCEALAVRLKREGTIDLIVASPMARALQTAMILSWRLDCRVEVELDLHEWVPDLSQQWSGGDIPSAAYQELLASGGEWPPGEERSWEPHSWVRRRVRGVLERHRADGRTVAVVCHSGVIEALTGLAETEPCGIVAFDLS